MTKYRIKEQENNRTEGIPTVLVALRAQIEATRLFLDSMYNETRKKAILIILALCYFPTRQLLQYCRRYNVSHSCSGWNEVVPLCYKYQNKKRILKNTVI